jgi:hypothetical protein
LQKALTAGSERYEGSSGVCIKLSINRKLAELCREWVFTLLDIYHARTCHHTLSIFSWFWVIVPLFGKEMESYIVKVY